MPIRQVSYATYSRGETYQQIIKEAHEFADHHMIEEYRVGIYYNPASGYNRYWVLLKIPIEEAIELLLRGEVKVMRRNSWSKSPHKYRKPKVEETPTPVKHKVKISNRKIDLSHLNNNV